MTQKKEKKTKLHFDLLFYYICFSPKCFSEILVFKRFGLQNKCLLIKAKFNTKVHYIILITFDTNFDTNFLNYLVNLTYLAN